MVRIINCFFLQLLVNFNIGDCNVLYKEDVNYKDTFCPDTFMDKDETLSNTICAAECGKEPACTAFFYDVMHNCYVIVQPLNSFVGCVYREGKLYKSETMTTTAAVTTTTVAEVTSTTAAGNVFFIIYYLVYNNW